MKGEAIMKTKGKVKLQCRDETPSIEHTDVPRAPNFYAGRRNKTEMDEHIKQRVNEIYEKYSLNCCLCIVGDFAKIPDALRELYCDAMGNNRLTVVNLDYNYRKYKSGQLDAYAFMCALDALFTTLFTEFAEITEMFLTGSIDEKENYNERT